MKNHSQQTKQGLASGGIGHSKQHIDCLEVSPDKTVDTQCQQSLGADIRSKELGLQSKDSSADTNHNLSGNLTPLLFLLRCPSGFYSSRKKYGVCHIAQLFGVLLVGNSYSCTGMAGRCNTKGLICSNVSVITSFYRPSHFLPNKNVYKY